MGTSDHNTPNARDLLAAQGLKIKRIIQDELKNNCGSPDTDPKIYDFGFRGISSVQSK